MKLRISHQSQTKYSLARYGDKKGTTMLCRAHPPDVSQSSRLRPSTLLNAVTVHAEKPAKGLFEIGCDNRTRL